MSSDYIINNLPKYARPAARFVKIKEEASGLSKTRFIQDLTTCLIPKAVFSRSKADLVENTFLETSEEALIYFVPAILGQHVARKVFSKGLSQNLKEKVAETGVELLEKSKNSALIKENNKKIMPIKAAIALTAMAIPLTEFSLNYIKNLMTLKVFKKSDFKNIASLEHNNEDMVQQEKVKNSAKKHIGMAASLYAGCLGLATLLATKGKNSKALQSISEFVVAPGTKLFGKNSKVKNFVNKYFSMDFNSQDGKLVLSKGQLTNCVLIGGAGYFGASSDRGKENLKETATRFPLVALYVITGSEFVEQGFKKLLKKMGKCKDLISDDLSVPTMDKLKPIAEKLAQKNGTTIDAEAKKLAKQKIMISGLPYVFSIGVMGFFVAGMTNYFTKLRYKKAQEASIENNVNKLHK